MVAIQRHSAPSARNLNGKSFRGTVQDARDSSRRRVALRAWLCAEEFSARGYALDLSSRGARFGGVGGRFAIGDVVTVKIEVDPVDAAVVLKAVVVRHAPSTSAACPDVCVRFLEDSRDEELWRIQRVAGA